MNHFEFNDSFNIHSALSALSVLQTIMFIIIVVVIVIIIIMDIILGRADRAAAVAQLKLAAAGQAPRFRDAKVQFLD